MGGDFIKNNFVTSSKNSLIFSFFFAEAQT